MTPRAEVHISDDQLQAHIEVPAGAALDSEQLKQMIQEAGVCFGLALDTLREATVASERPQRLQVAQGQAPVEPTPGSIEWLDAVLDVEVAQGTCLGAWQPAVEGTPGMSVTGDVLPAGIPIGDEPAIDATIDLQGCDLFARRAGKLRQLDDGRWTLSDAASILIEEIHLQVADNGLSVGLDLPPFHFVDANDLRRSFGESGITVGLIRESLVAATKPERLGRGLILAYGSAPKNGSDAELKFLIQRPEIDKASLARVDFRTFTQFREVARGLPLAEVIPAERGIAGVSVTNRTLAAQDGQELVVESFAGKGTAVSGMQILADTEGVVRQDKAGVISVHDELVIDGDVCLATGHVETTKPVRVLGDVRSGFKIIAGSDVYVHGLVEDADIQVQGDLIIEGGVLPGRHPIVVTGQVMAKFVRDREIRCRNLVVKQDIRICDIYAEESLHVGNLIGGRARVGQTVYCNVVGNSKEECAEIHIGIDADLFEQIELREATRAEEEKKANQHGYQALADEADDDEDVDQAEADTRVLMRRLLGLVRERQKSAYLEVDGAAFPGVLIRIGLYHRLHVHRRYGATIFRLIEGDLVALPLGGGEGAAVAEEVEEADRSSATDG